ncbi:hypothetical protein BDZ97DRAFT_1864579 [Flammula alnicola]|nr:hypothetical protein BDZ97DRAFT_1864579 [Flammula alnicola]
MDALHPHKPAHLIGPQRLALRGHTILTSPRFNKGTGFPLAERKAFAYGQLEQRDTPMRKNTFLQSLKDQNWTLYYALLARHLKELVPIIYTPTEAEAIANYSHIFRRSEGLYLTFPHEDMMEEAFLEQTLTDAEAILGIGDQGVGISTAKSVIYTLIGGMDPARSLSVTLDVGTNNQDLLNDPLYVGWPEKRVRGEAYDRFVDKFVQLVRKYYPHSLLHFEDFGVTNAHRLLDRYRDTHAVFNDDIQGTGAVTLACVMSAISISGRARLRDAMIAADGTERAEANGKFWLVDREGLLYEGLEMGVMSELRREFVRPAKEGWGAGQQERVSLVEVVKRVRPTVLIGCSTSAGAFTKEVGAHPIILPLSNPNLMRWSNGRALVATGSPFENVKMKVDGRDMEFVIAECNNALIYPGLGFGAILSQSRCVTDTMLIAGAKRLAALSPAVNDGEGADGAIYAGASLLPDFGDAPSVNFEVGVAVAEQAVREGSASEAWTRGEEGMRLEDVRDRAGKSMSDGRLDGRGSEKI